MNYPASDTCQVRCQGAVLEITLSRPRQGNALTPVEHELLYRVWQQFAEDEARRIAIVTGEGGRFFCAGNDLGYALSHDEFPMPVTGLAGLTAWFDREKPVIAAVNGAAAGGGFEIALACDLVVADEGATFSLPEVKVGTYAGAGGLTRLPRVISEKLAMEMILTGQGITAQRAFELGLVNAVTPGGGALEKAREMARLILQNSPSSIRFSKRIINQTRNMTSLEAAQQLSDSWGRELVAGEEFREGVSAFLEKRAPAWVQE